MREQTITLRVDGRRVAADVFDPGEHAAAGVLFVHGYNGHRGGYAPRARAVAGRLGVRCLTFDLGGHGQSEGTLPQFRREDHLRDLAAAWDELARRVEPGRIGVCAASYGAYLTSVLLDRRSARRLLLRAPALYVEADIADPDGRRPHLDQLLDADAALAGLAGFAGPTLVLESEHDELISQRTIAAYLQAAQHPTHHVLAGAPHALSRPEWDAAFVDEAVDWFTGL